MSLDGLDEKCELIYPHLIHTYFLNFQIYHNNAKLTTD